jgi:hypothetical protein
MWHDMKGLDSPDPMFQQTPDFLEFHKRVRTIAGNLAELLGKVPKWQSNWPVVRPSAPIPPTTSFPGW